jgi:hypothetical protein
MLPPAPLAFKPDLDDAARRWNAFYAGEIIDRPIVCVTAPRTGGPPGRWSSYHDRVFGDMDDIIERFLVSGEGTYYAGEAVPAAWLSFGPDEVAVFCGADLGWSEGSGDTNWSIPFVEDWEQALPLRLQEDHPLWLRMMEFYRRAAGKLAGKMLLAPLDLHTNMDLLAAIRGPQRLCEDTLDCPELLDRAMDDARAIFRQVWRAMAEAGRMDELGYTQCLYSMEGAASLQCDWCCMVGPEMFRRWVLPALEEEAEIVKHAIYHWDGPGAIVHTADLVASRGLHALSYVPGAGHGGHIEYLDLMKRVQAGGKAVQVWGSPDEMKLLQRELKPELTIYCTGCGSEAEADALLEWFVANT